MPLNRLYQIQSEPKTKIHPAVVLANCRLFFDFDHTITVSDVLDDIIQKFSINDHWMALEKAWLEGQAGTKECLQGQLRNVRVSKKDLDAFLKTVKLDPHFYPFLSFLTKEGIKPVIVSDNFTWIIESILDHQGIRDLKIYGNSLRFYRDRLIPSFPYDNPFCLSCAHCKKIHLTRDKVENKLIVYVGDGRSDLCPARVSDLVFAKDHLLEYLTQEGKPCLAYQDFGDIHQFFKEGKGRGHKNR